VSGTRFLKINFDRMIDICFEMTESLLGYYNPSDLQPKQPSVDAQIKYAHRALKGEAHTSKMPLVLASHMDF
jgi:hypothetical protein